MLANLRSASRNYPRQFWIVFAILVINTTATSFVWPFLTIYFRQALNISLTGATSLLAIESVATFLSTYFLSSLMDKHGRKWIAVSSLAINGLLFGALSLAETLPAFLVLTILRGVFNPLFRMGAETMIADLIKEEYRVDAYSIMRVGTNIGFAIGPIIGGAIIAFSYRLDFVISAMLLVFISVFAGILLRETLEKAPQAAAIATEKPGVFGSGIVVILKDKFFLTFLSGDIVTKIAMMLMFSIMSVFLKENHGIRESQYGWLLAINATMGVVFQMGITSVTKKFNPITMCALGAFLYVIGVGSIAFGTSFWHFAVSIIIASVAELIFMPTAISVVSRLSPPGMRARYMGFYSLSFGLSRGISPLMGGLLNDNIAPSAIWLGGAAMAAIGSISFLILKNRKQNGQVKPG